VRARSHPASTELSSRSMPERVYGMLYKYNTSKDTYILFGIYCSLEHADERDGEREMESTHGTGHRGIGFRV